MVGPEILTDWMGRFLAQLAVPDAQYVVSVPGDDPAYYRLIDTAGDSYAWLIARPDRTWTVIQGGADRLWDRVEETVTRWRDAGRPSRSSPWT